MEKLNVLGSVSFAEKERERGATPLKAYKAYSHQRVRNVSCPSSLAMSTGPAAQLELQAHCREQDVVNPASRGSLLGSTVGAVEQFSERLLQLFCSDWLVQRVFLV